MLVLAEDLVLMGKNEEDLKKMSECFYNLSEEGIKSECSKE